MSADLCERAKRRFGTPFDGAQDKQVGADERRFMAGLTEPAENPESRSQHLGNHQSYDSSVGRCIRKRPGSAVIIVPA